MTPDFPQDEREKLEAQLTAFLLGELPPDETVALCKAMERDPELAALYERLKLTVELVRESAVEPTSEPVPQSTPLKLSEERREKLLAQFKTIEPKEFAKPRRVMDWLIPVAAVSAMIMILAALLLPALSKSKNRSMSVKNGVINNLRLLDGAKQQWALENNKPADAEPTLEQLKPYLGRGSSDVQIPSVGGETYVPGKVSDSPIAELSQQQARRIMSRGDLAKARKSDGKVELSLDEHTDISLAQNSLKSKSASSPVARAFTHSAEANSDSQIILPPGGQVAANSELGVATNTWAFGLEQQLTPPSSDNKFIGRYGYIAPPPEQGLDASAIHSQAGEQMPISYALSSDISGALKTPALQNTNVVAFYGAVVSGVTNFIFSGDSYNSNTVYRMLSLHGADSETGKLAINNTNFFATTASVRGFYDDADSTTPALSNGIASTDVPLLGDVPEMGRLYRSGNDQTDAVGTHAAGIITMTPPATGLATTPAEAGRKTEIVLRPASPEYSRLQANGGSMPESRSGGAGGGGAGGNRPDLSTSTKSTPLAAGKQVEIAADANDTRAVGLNWSLSNNLEPNGAPSFDPATGQPVVAPPNPSADQLASYFAAKKALESEKHLQEVISMRANQEEVDKDLPRARMVTVVDQAQASQPEKPSLGQKIRETFSGEVERTARIEVAQEHPDIAGVGSGPTGNSYDPYFLQTEFQTIQSHAVLSNVISSLKLNEEWAKKYNRGQPLTESETEELIKRHLDVYPMANTKEIAIGAKSESPDEAARIANAVADAYRQYRSDEYEDLKNHGIKSLQQQLDDEDKKVKLAQARVDKLRADLKLNDVEANAPNPGSLMTADRLTELSSLLVQKEADYDQEKSLLDRLKSMDREDLKKALPTAVADNQLNSLLQELDLAKQNLIKLNTDLTPDHPRYKNAKDLVDDLHRKVDDRVDGIMLGMESRVASSKSYIDTLQADIVGAKQIGFSRQQTDAALPKPAVPPAIPQPEILTRENTFSTFSLNVSDVSFKLAAASLEKGQLPEPASIRSEEFINAFDYRDPAAAPGVPIAFAAERAGYPFAHNRELLRFSLKTAAAGRQAGRPLNIVLLLDNSGSMERADRVRIIQEALRVLAGQLQAQDTFSVVTFARTARLQLDGIHGNQAATAATEIAKLTPEGGTNLGEALDLAYETALHHYLANGDNRVVMLTDGAANLGDVNPDTLKQKVEAHRKQGVALDCFGIGWEGYNDDLLEVLTRNGDGRYGFINTPEEASTEFVAQIAGALHVAAADVKVQVEFNPKRVVSYRQIGYAKHQLTKEQFRDNTVDAAEIAAQEAGNALYTIETNPQGEGSIATVRVRYKVPGTSEYREQAWDVPYTGSAVALEQSSPAMRLAATASAFSEWLATSPFAAEVSPDQLLRYLNGVPQVYGADTRPTKLEWMIRQAKSISGK